jgi:hypothetical protein
VHRPEALGGVLEDEHRRRRRLISHEATSSR